jgi:hypothetical protein
MTSNQPLITTVKGMSPLTTAKFGPGMLLQHDDLEQLSNYTRDLSRLLFRSFFGCWVVCGLDIAGDQQPLQPQCGKLTFTLNPGLALDCCGDPVYVPQPQTISIDLDCSSTTLADLWVVLCGTSKCCAPRPAMCSADDQDSPSVCTRERFGFEIRVVSANPTCVCGCPNDPNDPCTSATVDKSGCQCADPTVPCNRDHYAGECSCSCTNGSDCKCECILLAHLAPTAASASWTVDYSVRCFIRPMRIRDPKTLPGA